MVLNITLVTVPECAVWCSEQWIKKPFPAFVPSLLGQKNQPNLPITQHFPLGWGESTYMTMDKKDMKLYNLISGDSLSVTVSSQFMWFLSEKIG